MKKWIVLFTAVLIFAGCALPEDPGLPTWQTTLEFYVLNDSYELTELAEEDSALVLIETVAGDTVLGIYQEEETSVDVTLDETESINEEEFAEIGDIALPEAGTIEGILTFEDFAEASGQTFPPQGTSVPEIPAISFGNVRQDLSDVEEIETVTIMEGSCTIEIVNNMIIGLGNHQEGEPLSLRLVHITDTDTIDVLDEVVFAEENLAIGESRTVEYDLAGVTLYRQMSLLISGGSRGTEGEPTVIDYFSELNTYIDFSESLTASEAEALIAAQTIEDTVSLDFDDRYSLTYAELLDTEDSKLEIEIENGIDLDLHLLVEIPALYMANETEHYSAGIVIPRSNGAIAVKDTVIDLGGAILNNDGAELDSLKIYASAWVDSTEDFRQIHYEDFYKVTAELASLEFATVHGTIEPQQQDPIEESIDLDIAYPELEEGAEFSFTGESSITFNVNFKQGSQVAGTLGLDVRSYDQFDQEVQLVKTATNEMPVIAIPVQSQFSLVFDSDTYNINELLSILPQHIDIVVNVTAGDENTEIVYNNNEELEAEIILESTLALACDTWIIPTEDGEVVIEEEEIDFEQEAYDAFKGAEIEITYKNTTGQSVMADILLSDSKAYIEEEIRNFENTNLDHIDLITIPELSVTGRADSILTINIADTDLDYLLEDYTYISSRLKLMSTGSQPLAGEVELQAKVKVTMEVSHDIIEEDE